MKPFASHERFWSACLLVAASACFLSCDSDGTATQAQPTPPPSAVWTKHPDNPVIAEGTRGWDRWPGDPHVLKDGSTYKLWFGTHDPSIEKTQIAYAESRDGILWTMHADPVLPFGDPGSFDEQDAETPSVVKDGTVYHLWYSADSGSGVYQIGHATSADGINWQKDVNNPVIRAGSDPSSWNGLGALEPTVIKEGDLFELWFLGISADPPSFTTVRFRLAYATSIDGSRWDLHPGNPLLELASGPWDKVINSAFFVLRNGEFYQLFYLGGEVSDVYATSQDGINWFPTLGTIIPRGPAGSWDSWIVSSPAVLLTESGDYEMWYSGAKIEADQFHFGIGFATAGR